MSNPCKIRIAKRASCKLVSTALSICTVRSSYVADAESGPNTQKQLLTDLPFHEDCLHGASRLSCVVCISCSCESHCRDASKDDEIRKRSTAAWRANHSLMGTYAVCLTRPQTSGNTHLRPGIKPQSNRTEARQLAPRYALYWFRCLPQSMSVAPRVSAERAPCLCCRRVQAVPLFCPQSAWCFWLWVLRSS